MGFLVFVGLEDLKAEGPASCKGQRWLREEYSQGIWWGECSASLSYKSGLRAGTGWSRRDLIRGPPGGVAELLDRTRVSRWDGLSALGSGQSL